jgi:cysteine synthase
MGGSTGINIAGAIRMARDMGPGKTIVTILCDYGSRYQSKVYNPTFPARKGPSRSGMAGPANAADPGGL